MPDKKTKILACAVLAPELEPYLPENIDCEILDFGLHKSPERLKENLQERINASGDYENIVLAYGLCGMAILGLHSDTSRIIVPRADDCIAILLGSRKAYLKEQRDHPGSLFLSRGWIDGKLDENSPYGEVFDSLLNRYGFEKAKRMYEVYERRNPLRHYHRLAYLSTPDGDNLEEYRTTSMERAEKLGLTYDEIEASTAFIKKIANADWDEEFIIISPGHILCLEDFWPDADKEQPPTIAWG